MEKQFLFAIFHVSFALMVVLVHGQDIPGFISIDCGSLDNSVDEQTGIYYTSDLQYLDVGRGENFSISPQFKTRKLAKQLWNVRSFSGGRKNCYTLRPSQGKNNTYLIRASFMYGNYDANNQFPVFDLYLGGNKWNTVKVKDAGSLITMEIIHVPQSDYIFVCLVNTLSGTPFISTLELRLLYNDSYIAPSGSLELFARLDCGLSPNKLVRYGDDVLDRIWTAFNYDAWDVLNTSSAVDPANVFNPPSLVMSTAVTPRNPDEALLITWSTDDNSTTEFYITLHLAEIENLQENQTREMNMYVNDRKWYGPFSPEYLRATTLYGTKVDKSFIIQINKTENSTLPPVLNALEIFTVKPMFQPQTDQNDVDAMMNIESTYELKSKSIYQVERDWQGDPCVPSNYSWDGLHCSFKGFDPPRIISLNLSSSELTGEITPYISNLTMLQILDLSNNNLSGTVPDFLSQMPYLRILNIENNNFSGTLPAGLQAKLNSDSFSFRADGNSYLCLTNPCKKEDKKKTNNVLIPVVASVCGFLAILLTAGVIFWCRKRRKQDTTASTNANVESNKKDEQLEPKRQQFSYSEVLTITNNFGRIVGKGGFGTVYYGFFDDSQVAVKMLSVSSAQGYKQFHAEAKLLTRVHHRNVTALVGYCDEGPNKGLIYEYMANGDLAWHLSDKSAHPLSWEQRLKIAIDAAQGLEYLHIGCKPPIIHRDVKTTNILLNEKLQAKLSDFGLSRAFPLEGDTHVSTIVAGTPGYLDPEYFTSYWLTEKSDVFSFGVVILEIITGRPAITKQNEKDHVIEWVKPRLSKGDITSIVDPRLVDQQDLNKNSIWKAVELALACVSPISAKRPTMTQIVIELKECLGMEMARRTNISDVTESSLFLEMMSTNTELGPLTR